MNEIEELDIKFTAGGLSVNIKAESTDVVYGSAIDLAAKILELKKHFGDPAAADTVMADLLDERRSTHIKEGPSIGTKVEQEKNSADDEEEELVERVSRDDDHGPLATSDKVLRNFLDEDPS